MTAAANAYILGHADEELARLARQGELFHDGTEALLRAAGLSHGMRVLDVGCGAGDVTLIASRLVGPEGSVLSIDRNDMALGITAKRAAGEGRGNVRTANVDLFNLPVDEPFDAVVGRFLLLHFQDAAPVIQALAKVVKPGGVIAFAEMDITSTSATPHFPLLETCLGWITELYKRSGLQPDMGSRLYGTFKAAGLTPALSATSRVETGLEGGGLPFLVGTLATMRPALLQLGVATEAELDIQKLAADLARDMVAGDHCVIYPRLIGAWARV